MASKLGSRKTSFINEGNKMAKSAPKGKVGKVMSEFKAGTLKSGSSKGPKVTDRKQAVAIGLSEARKAGESVGAKKARNKRVEKYAL